MSGKTSVAIARTGLVGLPQVLSTTEAAKFLNRRPQTLRKWACFQCGPIQPIRINGRLAWPVHALAALLEGK